MIKPALAVTEQFPNCGIKIFIIMSQERRERERDEIAYSSWNRFAALQSQGGCGAIDF